MGTAKFVYIVYIATSPEKLWAALTDAEFTEQYWAGEGVQSDWKVGSPIKFVQKEGGGIAIHGQVLQYAPPRLLAYTFQVGPATKHPSRVVFELEAIASVVRLTVTHDELDDKGLADISRGWPQILSSLKSLLEGGRPLAYEQWN